MKCFIINIWVLVTLFIIFFCGVSFSTNRPVIPSMRVSVDLSYGTNISDFIITATGEHVDSINDNEAKRWGLFSQSRCKEAIQKVSSKGILPDDCYLHAPPNKISYGVDSHYVPTKIEVISRDIKNVSLDEWRVRSPESYATNVSYSPNATVQHRISNKWLSNSILKVDSRISIGYEIRFDDTFEDGRIRYTHFWGEENVEVKPIIIQAGDSSAVIPPNSNRTFKFSTKRLVLTVEVTYSNFLSGTLTAIYKNCEPDSWISFTCQTGYDVNVLLKAINVNNSMLYKERIIIDYFMNYNEIEYRYSPS